ncbi:hypothetical protein [Aliamphritea spongicola]|nr:hypothetical protein [Aliamphritea spongicola]
MADGCAVIFGGSGFIGSHFSQYLLDNHIVSKVLVFDIEPLDIERTTLEYKLFVESEKSNINIAMFELKLIYMLRM